MDKQAAATDATIVVGIGEALFDCFGDEAMLGGAPVNLTVHAHQLLAPHGGHGIVVSRVGQDDLGDRLVSQLAQRGMDATFLQRDATYPTGTVQVTLSDKGEPSYHIAEDVAWDHLEFDASLEELAGRCSAVGFGTLAQRHAESRSAIRQFLAAASRAIRLYDVNLRQDYYSREMIEQSLRLATAAKLNQAELQHLGKMLELVAANSTEQDLAFALCEKFELDLLAVTQGAKGTVLFTGGTRVEGEVFRFEAEEDADSVGAGDACCAGILYGMLMDWPPRQTVDLANRLGAFLASQLGATPRLPADMLPA